MPDNQETELFELTKEQKALLLALVENSQFIGKSSEEVTKLRIILGGLKGKAKK